MKKTILEPLILGGFILNILTFGMYYEFCGAIWAVILSCAVLLMERHQCRLEVRRSLGAALYLFFLAGYIITIPYAVDSGMAFLGLGKIIWIAPFLLLYQQMDETQKRQFYKGIPWIGSACVCVGLIGYFIMPLKELLWVNHRLGGPFQYPNTFALFLLVGLIVLLHEEKQGWKPIICFVSLCVGIAATGSRIVMVLSIFTLLFLIWQKKYWKLGAVTVVLGVLAAAYILLTQDTASIGRVLRISFTESTFVGRILYAQDALKLLLQHPFGMGYLGYYYTENMVQTGVYTVRYVHNDWLQIGLDIGWIPMLAYFSAVVGGMWSKQLSSCKKWILVVVFLHGLLDYDLSFSVILCLVVVTMDDVLWKMREPVPGHIYFSQRLLYALTLTCAVTGFYIFIPTIAEYRENYRLAASVYPWHTEANLHLISESEDMEEVENLAERVVRQNDTCALAYYAKAFSAYCKNEYESMICYQREAISRDYFNYEEYLNYAYMLYEGVLYSEDENVREQCRDELIGIPRLLEAAKEKLSFLGKHIADQPELEIEEKLRYLMEEVLES